MQKLDFIKKIETIVERLKSKEIVKIFQEGFSRPKQAYNYGLLNPLLFTSKSQFDQILLDTNLEPVMSLISGSKIYEEFPRDYNRPVVVAGFEPVDVMQAISMLVKQFIENRCELEIEYKDKKKYRDQNGG